MTLHTFPADTYVVENVYSMQWKHRLIVHVSREMRGALTQGSGVKAISDYHADVQIPGALCAAPGSRVGMEQAGV